MSKVLVTGVAGFIGYHVAERLIADGDQVIGLDSVTDYYDVGLKNARLARLEGKSNYSFHRVDLADEGATATLFDQERPELVIHLAAQPGVRYSLQNPRSYVQRNLVGFLNVLEGCRQHEVRHLVYASTSSVYGSNSKMPFSEHDNVDHPLSLYAATKKSNELMAHCYSHLFRIPSTGLRFFTVYGPWGRPDMAPILFTKAILEGRPIDVFNQGHMKRDFTYVDDIVEGVVRLAERPAEPDPSWSSDAPDPATSDAPFRIYNIGNSTPVDLMEWIGTLEQVLGKTAQKNYLPMQPGDIPATWADVSDLRRDVGYKPDTPLREGISRFVDWYRDYYGS